VRNKLVNGQEKTGVDDEQGMRHEGMQEAIMDKVRDCAERTGANQKNECGNL